MPRCPQCQVGELVFVDSFDFEEEYKCQKCGYVERVKPKATPEEIAKAAEE